ncbi:ArsR/SmtB family transcription factor [Jannaschia sp. 2305UL9-9]|uniref:ArsR/SmtB family transcription factor n=1 Tax=Jannaschia sp. 2305UL9-9 TaxID=3121638 RepID=UPI0035272DE0
MKLDTDTAAEALAALGHPARLSIFRLLVRAGPDGLRVGDLAAHLDLAPSTLAHHLRALVQAGLVNQTRHGREVRCDVDFAATRGLLGFLTEECCTGVRLSRDAAA